jgi:hypothetical protein
MWSMSSSSSDDENSREAWRRRSLPDNELPSTAGRPILLGRTDDLAIAVSELRVYRNGLAFTLTGRCRGQLARRGILFDGLSGHSHPRRESIDPFLLGFEYSDGRSVANIGAWPPELPDAGDDGPWLTNGGGGGGSRAAAHEFFLSPLPSGDTLTLIAAWPALGLAESRHVLDAAEIRAAAELVMTLWPPESDDDGGVEPPPPPAVPPGSWFDRN